MFGPGASIFGSNRGISKSSVPDAVDTGPVARRDLRAALLFNNGNGQSADVRRRMLAPWKSTGMPPVQQQAALPDWVSHGARLCYSSRSTGKQMEVIVDKIFTLKQEVKIVFANDPETWKRIPFSMIGHRGSPLLGPWVPGASGSEAERHDAMMRGAIQSKPDKDLLITRLKSESVEIVDDEEDQAARQRSRSPKR
mmetsp:Transcript_61548/g.133211  ORF Transcript_61548/g.133211 Transcript_61548/m.133211 type:complete len:196 (-) Transcript_61548:157-744(-)